MKTSITDKGYKRIATAVGLKKGQEDVKLETVIDILADMWDGIDVFVAQLRRLGLSPDTEKAFWDALEADLETLKEGILDG